MVEFAGYTMPVNYASGVMAEHAAVRQQVGIFDITHMGEIFVTGGQAETWLDGLVTNKIAGIPPGRVVYTAMCRSDGGVLDDMLVYRLAEQRWLVVCNAANHIKISRWLAEHASGQDVVLEDASYRTAMIAVQGPDSLNLLGKVGVLRDQAARLADLAFYSGTVLDIAGQEWIVSRTGYTGERGYEIYLPNTAALALWEELMQAGAEFQVLPVGLAARDTLRLEMGYCLYDHELTEEITPLEAGIGWAVKFKKGEYIGKQALDRQKQAGIPRRLVGLQLAGRAIARQGAPVLSSGQAVGFVTSGTFSPTLKVPLALALIATELTTEELQVEVRGRLYPCRTVPVPFIPARVKGDPRAERNLPQAAG
jgi:aminomethyltransferase